MMNFLPLCKAIIQHQRMSKGGYRFGAKNNRKLVGCSKDEILDQYNNVVQSAGNTTLTSDFSLKGDRAYGDDCYTGTYTADYKDFSKTEYLFGGTSIERENGGFDCYFKTAVSRLYNFLLCVVILLSVLMKKNQCYNHSD